MMRSLRIITLGTFAALAVAACSSNDSNSGTTTPSNNPPASTTSSDTGASPSSSATEDGGTNPKDSKATGTITIQNFQFGEPLQVKPGATITVVNKDSQQHNVVSDDGGKSFKTELLSQNQSATITAPTKPGTY